MKVKYFAWVRERVGIAEETIDPPPSVRTVDDLIGWLAKRGETYAHAFETPRLFTLMFLTKREGARQYPEDFRARRSPTANVSADVIARAMETGYFREDDVWEIVFETGALMQGLVMLYLGGRMAMSPESFRAFCHRSFGRYLNGIRS